MEKEFILEKELIEIEVGKIKPHPDNPRKNLGELEEMVESIKKNGVLQNLSVVPAETEGEYLCLIGHRRLEASKQAGLEKLTCVVLRGLSLDEQVGIMLAENIQRNDLTVWEQAQGFQRMMDLGAAVSDIAEKTGFSASTIKRRVSLLSLDENKFKKSQEKNPTLSDYLKLTEITDKKLQDKCLSAIGTNNFDYEIQKAKDAQKRKDWFKKTMDIISSFATKKEGSLGFKFVATYSIYGYLKPEVPADAGERKYYYEVSGDSYVYLYTEKSEEEKNKETKEAEEAERLRKKQAEKVSKVKEAEERFKTLRLEFMKNFRAGKTYAETIVNFAVRGGIISSICVSGDKDELFEILNIGPVPEIYEEAEEKLIKAGEAAPYVALAAVIFTSLNDGQYYRSRDGEYVGDEDLDFLYEFLTAIGYEEADEEKEFRKGTLFKK